MIIVHDEGDIDTLARTIWGEARGEPQIGQVAVAWVIRNRAARTRFAGQTVGMTGAVKRVCKAKSQFSCWWDQQAINLIALSAAKMPLQIRIGREVCDGLINDPTYGADHYHTIARPPSAEQWPPYWASGMLETARIGAHVFYKG